MPKDYILLEKIKKNIDQAEIVSFDIFDTLLLRPYVKPTDLFFHIERVENCSHFESARKEAEDIARRKHPELEDVSYDMIYDAIDDNFKSLKQKELDWEEMVLRANPELMQVYDYVKEQGKKIVIASDMYLPEEFVAKVLNKTGYSGWDKIYISGNINKTKVSGSLYKQILSDFDCNPNEILHIGDNKVSDFEVAASLGIKVVLYTQVVEQYLNANEHLRNWYTKDKNDLGASILLAQLAYRWQKQRILGTESEDYWSDLGYRYAGPVAYGYTRFIEQEVHKQNIEELLFVARDGYTLQKVFNVFNQDIKSEYIYAPRFLNLICRLDYNKSNKKNSSVIINYYREKSAKINELYEQEKPETADELHYFIKNHINEFLPLSVEVYDNYKKYLSSHITTEGKVGIVDLITGEFSSQRLLEASIKNKVCAFYWSVIKNFKWYFPYEFAEYIVSYANNAGNDSNIFTKHWDFMEFLITSPEHPIVNITPDDQPVYKNNCNAYEQYRSEIYEKISSGAVDFAKDIQELFNGYDIYLDGVELVQFINNYIENPAKQDIENMSKIYIGQDSDHEEFIPLFCSKMHLKDLQHIKRNVKSFKNLHWLSFSQKLLMCLNKPLSVRTRGLKQISVLLFPQLDKQYFNVSLKLNPKWFYRFVVGSSKL